MGTVQTVKNGPGVLTFGEHEIAPRVAAVTLKTKTDSDDDVYVLSGDVVPGDVTETQTLEGTLYGDWGTADSFQEWCFDHRGEVVPFVYQPLGPTKKGIVGEAQIAAVDIGGDSMKTSKPDFEFKALGAKTVPPRPGPEPEE